VVVRDDIALFVDDRTRAEAAALTDPRLDRHHRRTHVRGDGRHRTGRALLARLGLGERDVGGQILGPVGQQPAGHSATRADQQRDHGEQDQGVHLHPAAEQHLGQAQQLTGGLRLLRGAVGVLLVPVDGRGSDHRARRRVAPRVVCGVGIPRIDAVAGLTIAARRSLQEVLAAFGTAERRGQSLGCGRSGSQLTEVRAACGLPGREGTGHTGRTAERRGRRRVDGRSQQRPRREPRSVGTTLGRLGVRHVVHRGSACPIDGEVGVATLRLCGHANALDIGPGHWFFSRKVCVSDRRSAVSRSRPC
jgi:hypothetical protein